MRLLIRRRGARHAAGTALAVPDATPQSAPDRTSEASRRPVIPRVEALGALGGAAVEQGLRVEVRPEALRLSAVGAVPLHVWVDYTRGAWCYMWLRPENGTTSHPEPIGPVRDLGSVLRTIAYTLHEGPR